MTVVYIGLGSNMESPSQHITTAIKSLDGIQSTHMITSSSLYESKPIGPQDQDNYVNAVVKLKTELGAVALLDSLQKIENEHGRVRNERWGPRTLDLDILMFGNEIIKNDRLIVPHSEMASRAFVLVPLSEIEPDCEIPGKGKISDLLMELDQSGLKKLQ